MQVLVRYLGLFRTAIKKDKDEIELRESSLLNELMNKLVEVYGEPIKKLFDVEENMLDPAFIVTVNNVSADQLKGMETKLKDGDRIGFMTLVSGG
jgi:MoaD family protein